MKAKNIMTTPAITVQAGDDIKEVANKIVDSSVSGFPVVDADEHVVGVITEGDLLRRMRQLDLPVFVDILGGLIPLKSMSAVEKQIKDIAATQVRDLMTRPAITISEDTELVDIADLLVERNVTRVPVVDAQKKLVGIVSRSDVVRAMTKEN